MDGRDFLADLLGSVPQWQERALCAQTDPEAFFPEKGGSTREAKRICTRCDVKAECLEFALAHDERFGIWGGLSERERRKAKREAREAREASRLAEERAITAEHESTTTVVIPLPARTVKSVETIDAEREPEVATIAALRVESSLKQSRSIVSTKTQFALVRDSRQNVFLLWGVDLVGSNAQQVSDLFD